MNAIINLKKHIMTFDKKELRVNVPLDPTEGARYNERVRYYYEEDDIEQIYNLTMQNEDWVNPTVDGKRTTPATWIQVRSSNIGRIDCIKYQHYDATDSLSHSDVYLPRYEIYRIMMA